MQVIREHPRQPNLLFVGTEFGVFATTDAGAHWTQLSSGIPGVPVHDLAIQQRANDLVVGTHGRGIYILDDLTPLERLAEAKAATVAYLFPVQDALLFQPNTSRNSGMGTSGFADRIHHPVRASRTRSPAIATLAFCDCPIGANPEAASPRAVTSPFVVRPEAEADTDDET